MNTTTAKRGATGKFLALIASLTMIIAGLVGVAVAAPASATQEVCKDLDTGKLGPAGTSITIPAPPGKVIVETCVKAGSDTSVPDGAVQYATYNPGVTEVTLYGPGGKNISHYSVRYADAPTSYTFKAQKTFTKEICKDLQTMTPEPVQGAEISKTQGTPFTDPEKAAIELEALKSAEAAFDKQYQPYTDGACDTPDVPKYNATLTCTTWSASVEIPVVESDERARELVVYDVEVFLDDSPTPIAQGNLDKDGKWSGSGEVGPFADGKTHTLTVKVNGEPVKTVTSVVCPQPECTVNCGESVTYSAPGGSELFCDADVDVTVSWAGASGQSSQGLANQIAEANKAAALARATGTPGACTPKTPPVTTSVVAPLAATVSAPKPATVGAPKPAKVEGGVAGTVGVPQAATVPAAVPAGDGSQAPGLPMWALALIVVGALGAAAAGKQMLGARE